MKPIKANEVLKWLHGEIDAFRSIFQLTEVQAQEMIDNDLELDPFRAKLAHHLIRTQPKPVNSSDALLIALDRAEMKLQAIRQMAESLAPALEL